MIKGKRGDGRGKIEGRCSAISGLKISNRSSIFLLLSSFFIGIFILSGCATAPKKSVTQSETTAEQIDAAQKVVGAMAGGREMTQADLKRVVKDVRTDAESRSAVQKILGATESPVIKYSPVTGKHYSGDLEFDPETGARLEIIKE